MSLADPLSITPLVVPQEVCRDFERSSRLEWLDTNHTGAFAMGTVAGVNTRRYHSLLLATLNPPADRYSILPRVEDTLVVDGRPFALSSVQYPGVVQPRGFETLTQFAAEPFPVWQYSCGSVSLKKSVCLLDGQQAVLVRYEATGACQLSVQLFLSCRDYHSLSRKNPAFSAAATLGEHSVSFQPYPGIPPVSFHHNATKFDAFDSWYLGHEYLRELERGLDFQEDLCAPGTLFFDIEPGRAAYFIAALEPFEPGGVEEVLQRERTRRKRDNLLGRALDQFQVRRQDGQPTLIAGYPWFTDWSRDTLISLPAFAPTDTTKAILQTLISEKKQGILPNRFSDTHSQPEYNTVDASLWFFVAARSYLLATDDVGFLRDVVYPAALDIIDWHIKGTFFNIVADPVDHLLSAGSPNIQLTWMDAKIGDYVVTPRNGKPVEINALWYNALAISSEWALKLGETAAANRFSEKAQAVLESFNARFWNAARNCLYDVLRPDGPDDSLRPNQIFAASLPFPLLSRERAEAVIRLVRERLLTPVGLRTLEPGHPQYQRRFEGDMGARDRAYHQGTVWPWLIGPFINAWLYAFDNSAAAQEECRQILLAMTPELKRCCLGSFSEVYDAEPPHLPGGCPAQLWSVAQFVLAARQTGVVLEG